MPYRQSPKVQREKTKEAMQRIHDRGHIYVEGTYRDQSSPLIVFCPEHGTENVTTFNNYRPHRMSLLWT